MRGNAGAQALSTGVPPLHQRTTNLSAQCLVQLLHVIAEDGALQRQEVSNVLQIWTAKYLESKAC